MELNKLLCSNETAQQVLSASWWSATPHSANSRKVLHLLASKAHQPCSTMDSYCCSSCRWATRTDHRSVSNSTPWSGLSRLNKAPRRVSSQRTIWARGVNLCHDPLLLHLSKVLAASHILEAELNFWQVKGLPSLKSSYPKSKSSNLNITRTSHLNYP